MKKVRLTLIKSTIGVRQPHRRTVEALGLKHLNHTLEKELSPAVAGMIKTVSYLLEVEELEA